MFHTRVLGILGIGFVLAACSSSSSVDNGDGGTPGDSGTADAGTGGDGGSGGLAFKPSNLDLSGFDLSNVGDVTASGSGCIIDAENDSVIFSCLDDSSKVAHQVVTLADQSRLSVYVMKSLRVEASTVITTRGHIPIVIVALDQMNVLGSFNVTPGTAAGSFNQTLNTKGAGAGGGTSGDTTSLAGGGGSYCGLGGKAGSETTAAPNATPAYGTPQIVPLVGGSAGGSGSLENDVGAGGGAIQLVAGTSFALKAGGYVSVGGGGGEFGGAQSSHQEAGGGGSGGSILIEAPTVTIEGTLAANGGGGGQGRTDAGEVGRSDDKPALGGHKANDGTNVSSPGGSGSAGAAIDGSPGTITAGDTAPGGGGGAGRIRINTTSGAATISGTISPPVTSACSTQGKLGS